jgi:preprotein translocase subunit SecA
LREGIGLRGYGQKDPLLEYKSEGYDMFVKTIDNINRDVVSTLFKYFDVSGEVEERQIAPQNFKETHSQVEIFKDSTSKQKAPKPKQSGPAQPVKRTPVVKTARVGRNEPCPCGSGKKYKHCCGRNT